MKDPFGMNQEPLEETSALKQRDKELERSDTERVRIETMQQESVALLTAYLENAPDGIFIHDMKGSFLYGNSKSEEIIGYRRDELIGKNFFELNLVSETSLNRVTELLQASIEGRSTGPDELELISKDGRLIPVEINTSVIQGMDQRIVLGFVRDITDRKRSEEALKENERKFRTLFDTANDSIFIIRDYLIVDCNRKTLDMFCCCKRDIVGRSPIDFSPETQPDGLLSSTKGIEKMNMAMKGVPQFFEWKHLRMDGTPFDAEISINSIELGGDTYLQAIARDITEREQAKKVLQESEERYRKLVEGINKGIFVAQDGMLRFVNPMFIKIFGYSRNDLTTLPFTEFIHPDDRNMVMERHIRRMAGEKFVTMYDFRIIANNGSIRWVELDSVMAQWEGKPASLGFIDDITDRKHAEEVILREREKLRTLSDNAPFGMVLIHTDGHFTYINNKFTQLFGYDLSDIPDGRAWFRKAYPDTGYRHVVISTWVEDFRDAKPGQRIPRVFTVACKDGTQKIMEFIPSMLASGDYLMTCEDITELRRLESQLRQAQKMESIGTLAGGIAHDFNNILTALMGYTALMQTKMDKSSPLRQYADHILSASQKAADLTGSLLTFSRKQPVTLIPLDVNNTIGSTRQLLKRLLTEDIELRTSLTQDDTVVMADKSQMDQVLFNLATNARDAMPKGGTLTIETDVTDMDGGFIRAHGFGEPGRYVLISVSDTGTGMDGATQEKIFDPFFTTKETGKGTGLGLATVYGITKQHNGYITVYSEPNRGTTFHIYLPATMTKVDEEHDTMTPIVRGNETILIAEDDEEVRHIMRDVLHEYGYKTIEAIDGEDAIDIFKQHHDIDLIIADSVMPRKNGREVYEEIHGIDPHIKVIFTSGYTKDVILDKGIEDKKFDFIGKPLILDKLLQKVREVLDR